MIMYRKTNIKGLTRCALMALLSIAFASCTAKLGVVDSSKKQDIENGLVVRDFIVATSQLFNPIVTTLQLNEPESSFGIELENGLREVGYGMQRVSSDHGPKFLSYSKTVSENSTKIAITKYQIFIGDISLERTYAVADGGGIAPVGPMTLYGTDKLIALNAELFPGQSAEVVYEDDKEISIDADSITVINTDVMSAITSLRSNNLPSYKSLNSQNQEIENLFNRGTSNFESVDERYRTVRKDIIIFDDDSLVLKRKGRDQITKMMKFYAQETDVFRLIGCSIGSTKHKGGNVELALGRSERVAKELIARSVAVESIFDEGCWASSPDDSVSEYPPRAVVVELQRRG